MLQTLAKNLAKFTKVISKIMTHLSNYESTNQARNTSGVNRGGGAQQKFFSSLLTVPRGYVHRLILVGYVTVAKVGSLAPSGSNETQIIAKICVT